jgi:phosphate transport system ATP-binding protein
MCDLGTKIQVRHLSVAHAGAHALSDISFDVRGAGVTVVLGAADSGKTALLRALTRLHLDESIQVSGSVEVRGEEIYAPGVDLAALHRRVGMVFSAPSLFPGSIATNIAYGLRVASSHNDDEIGQAVETSLRMVGLWSSVRTNLGGSPGSLTREEQQRLCIARALVLEPEILLLDDPARDFDHLGRRRLEDLLTGLRAHTTVVLATRDVREAARLGDDVVFLSRGRVVETGVATDVLSRPRAPETVQYIAASA